MYEPHARPQTRARVDRPSPGEVVRTTVGGNPVAVWNVEGRLHALGDICPHRGFVLSEGALIKEKDGTMSVVCQGHFWRFDLTTGQAAFRPECVKVYDIEEIEDIEEQTGGVATVWVVDPDLEKRGA